MADVTILGSGGWGIALSIAAAKRGHKVSLWSPFPEEIETLGRQRVNERCLPGVTIPETVFLTSELGGVSKADILIIATPSFAVRSVASKISAYVRPGTIVVNAAKGLEEETDKRLSEVIREEIPEVRIVCLSGPSHAEEVSRNIPTTLVAASEDMKSAGYVQDMLMMPTFRIYTNSDLVGVELGGAFKNIIALAAGVCDGLQLGDNTKAALMTRGITEIARIGVALGARQETFAGLSGLGDLIVTCTSMHSRNRRAGILIGKGYAVDEVLKQIGMTVEGYYATKAAHTLAERLQVEMPIIEECYQVLYKNKKPANAIRDLMQRPGKHEIEEVWLQ